MRKLIVSEFLTLDGVMQAPGGKDEDPSGGFDRGGWQMPYFDDVFAKRVVAGISNSGGFVLGRKTYDLFFAYWPTAPQEQKDVAVPLNALPKYVVSRTLREPLKWENSILLKDDIAEEIRSLKDQPGRDLMTMGSGELVQTMIKEGLVDEYYLMIHPLVLGKGKRLFREGGAGQVLKLVESASSSTGVMILRYQVEGGA